MAKNTARSPNIHWYGTDLRAGGFFDELTENGSDAMILGLHLPEAHLRAWTKLVDGELSEQGQKEAAAIIKDNPPELTWRMNDKERTLCGTYNESHTCPPDCST